MRFAGKSSERDLQGCDHDDGKKRDQNRFCSPTDFHEIAAWSLLFQLVLFVILPLVRF